MSFFKRTYNHKFKQVSCLTTKYCICKQNQVFGLYQDINKGTRTSDNDIVWWILAMTLTAWLQKRDSPIPHYVLPTLMNESNVVYNVCIFLNKTVENTGIFILANVRVLYMLDSFHFFKPNNPCCFCLNGVLLNLTFCRGICWVLQIIKCVGLRWK